MPELPEVQTIVDDLNRRIIGKKIIDLWSDTPKAVKKSDFKSFKNLIIGRRITGVERRAKNILINLDGGLLLLIHLKMTGHLLLGKWKIEKINGKLQPISLISGSLKEKVNDYIHFIFYFQDGEMLGFSDLRKFGKVVLGEKEKVLKEELSNIGPEALQLSREEFSKIIGNRKGKIKQVLMDQKVIAGIGNIYADEILFKAGISPLRPAALIDRKKMVDLYQAMNFILKKAIKLRGSSVSDYRDTSGLAGEYANRRLVYQKEGEPCPAKCGGVIKRIKLAGRSSHYCPDCQK